MKLREKKVSEALWKLFYFTVVVLCIGLICLALSENPQQTTDGKIFLLKILAGISVFGVVAVILINSINITRDYENKVKWRKKDLQWMKESIAKVEKLLQIPETNLRKKMEEFVTVNIKIDGVGYQIDVSTLAIPIENIRGLLEKYRDSLVRQCSEKKIPAEPKIFKFWKKTLSLFLENQNPEPQSGY